MYGLWRIFLRINSSILEQKGRHFADHIFKCICMNEKRVLRFYSNFTVVCF